MGRRGNTRKVLSTEQTLQAQGHWGKSQICKKEKKNTYIFIFSLYLAVYFVHISKPEAAYRLRCGLIAPIEYYITPEFREVI